MDISDQQLAEKAQRGDIDAFGELVTRYEARLLRYGHRFLTNRDDIADLVQNAFIKAFKNINSYDLSRPFSPWMYRIAHNEFVSALRSVRRALEQLVDWDAFTIQPVASEQTDRDALDREFRTLLDRCLASLDAKYREPLVLFYEEGLSYEEIADIMHIPVATVGVRIHRARDALRKGCADTLSHH